MASRAILRRKRHLFNSLNRSTGMIWGFSSFDYGGSSQVSDSWDFTWSAIHPSENIERRNKGNSSSLTKEEVLVFSARGFLRHTAYGVPTSGYGIKRTGFLPPLGVGGIAESIRYFSNAEAGRSELDGSNDVNDEKAVNQKKEASPEECDQAVEGLSTVKAKAKAKQLQESQKDATSVLKKVWAMLIGIGPALRAVASMSREDWAKKLHHWKDEFKSTMQHYWLGTKLLWADVRISLRLLLKLASGKNLSRRERQQLTRTTADIFRTR